MPITVTESLRHLDRAVETGAIADVCRRHGIEIVALFGSALSGTDPGDIDLAVGVAPDAPGDFLAVISSLADLVPGDHLDVMDLNRADPVAQRAAMDSKRVLYESSPSVSAEREIRAFMEFEDTRWLRDLQRACFR